MYLIDTSVWIDFLKKREDRLTPFLESREACLTDIVLFELLSGVSPEKQGRFLNDLDLFTRLPLTEEAVLKIAPIAHVMRRRGLSPKTTDMLIAGTALVHGAVLIHKDRDFERIQEFCSLKAISFLLTSR